MYNNKPSAKEELSSLVAEYRASGDLEIRNRIIMSCQGMLRAIAIEMRGSYYKYAEPEDIISQGAITLIDCIDKYDKSKNAKFETYASIRIRGAIIDFVRQQDWVPRRVRRAVKEIEDASAELVVSLGREPSDKELADFLGISERELSSSLAEGQGAAVLSFEGVLQDVQSYFLKNKVQNEDEDPEGRLLKLELHKALKNSILSLNKNEQTVISLYYYEEIKLSDIAEILNLSQARVCQIHSKAILKMKESLSDFMQGG